MQALDELRQEDASTRERNVLFNGILTVGTGCYMANGIYKIKNGWGTEDLIRVRDEDGREMDMPRRLYEEEGYRPWVRELPEKDSNGNP